MWNHCNAKRRFAMVHKKRTADSKLPVPCMPSLAKLKQEEQVN